MLSCQCLLKDTANTQHTSKCPGIPLSLLTSCAPILFFYSFATIYVLRENDYSFCTFCNTQNYVIKEIYAVTVTVECMSFKGNTGHYLPKEKKTQK